MWLGGHAKISAEFWFPWSRLNGYIVNNQYMSTFLLVVLTYWVALTQSSE